MARLLFFFDYVDPFSWIVDARLEALESLIPGLEVERFPFELRPPEDPPIDPTGPSWRIRMARAVDVAEAEGLAYEPQTWIPRSRKAMELAFHSAATGTFDRVHRMLFEAHLSRGLDTGRVDVLVQLAVDAGLDRSEAKAVLDVDRYTGDVEAWRKKATELGVNDAPVVLTGSGRLDGLPDPGAIEALLHDV